MNIQLHPTRAVRREGFMLYYRRRHLLLAFRIILGFFLFAILVLNLIPLALQGAAFGAGPLQILLTYPRYLADQQDQTVLLGILVALWVITSPRAAAWMMERSAPQDLSERTLVLSDMRMVLYRPDGQYAAYYYGDVTGLASGRRTLTLFLGQNLILSIPRADITEEQEELITRLCSRRLSPPGWPLCPPAQPHEGAVWEQDVQLSCTDLASALWACQRSGRRPVTQIYIAEAAVFGVAGLGLLFFSTLLGVSIGLILAAVILLIKAALAWRYPHWRRQAELLTAHPLLLRTMSGRVWMSEECLGLEGPGGLRRTPWDRITDVLSWKGGILLLDHRQIVQFLPARCFDSPQQLDELAAWLRRAAHME